MGVHCSGRSEAWHSAPPDAGLGLGGWFNLASLPPSLLDASFQVSLDIQAFGNLDAQAGTLQASWHHQPLGVGSGVR